MKRILTIIGFVMLFTLTGCLETKQKPSLDLGDIDIIAKSIITTVENGYNTYGETSNDDSNDDICEDKYDCKQINYIEVLSAVKFKLSIPSIEGNHRVFNYVCDATEYDIYIGDVLLDIPGWEAQFDYENDRFYEDAVLWSLMVFRAEDGCTFTLLLDSVYYVDGKYQMEPAKELNAFIDEYTENGIIDANACSNSCGRYAYRADVRIEEGKWIKDPTFDKDGNYINDFTFYISPEGEIKIEGFSANDVIEISFDYSNKLYNKDRILYKIIAGELYPTN